MAESLSHIQSRSTDELTDEELLHELETLNTIGRRVHARTARLTAAVTDRRAQAARRTPGGDEHAAERARKRAEREVAERLRQTQGEAARNAEQGRRGTGSPRGDDAFDRGELPSAHAKLLSETLGKIADADERLEAEERLLDAASTASLKEFAKTCRLVLATLDHAAAAEAEQRRHARRQASTWNTPDGMTAFRGEWGTVEGEIFTTALHAFRRHDAPGERRTYRQQMADAAIAMAAAALRAGEAPTQHGVRPHVFVTIDWQTILDDAGIAHLGQAGPVPYEQVRHTLADCNVSRILTDPRGLPVEAGESVRTVGAGLYRQLVVRDGGCCAVGCEMPAQFCQVMHLDVPYRLGGRLTLDTAGLGCPFHHGLVDNGDWVVSWVDQRPVYHPPGRPAHRPLSTTSTDPPSSAAAPGGNRAGTEMPVRGTTRHEPPRGDARQISFEDPAVPRGP